MEQKEAQPIRVISGGVTAAHGFTAAGATAGIKSSGRSDTGIIYSSRPCTAAGTFTRNAVRAACVDWNENILPADDIHAVVCNSGNANACTGSRGVRDVNQTAELLAGLCSCSSRQVLVASTGVIGEYLPMEKVGTGIRACHAGLSGTAGGHAFAEAILTTDTVEKEYAVSLSLTGGTGVIGGCVKGSGMIHPDMATMLGFICTDVQISSSRIDAIVKRVVDWTFNNLTVDGDTSTNDMVLVLANGASGVGVETAGDETLFQQALFDVCNALCARIAGDGEGATKRIEINVTGGETYTDCKRAAKAVANSLLVKTALFGCDPNWGRILCAIGYSGASFSSRNIAVSLCDVPVCRGLRPVPFDNAALHAALSAKEVSVTIDLGMGHATCAVAHTCDLSYDYVKINAEYHT